MNRAKRETAPEGSGDGDDYDTEYDYGDGDGEDQWVFGGKEILAGNKFSRWAHFD